MDAFATERFTGNSAAVCLLPAGVAQTLGSQGLQAIAAELNQPATCFVSLLKPADTFAHAEAFALKWFSPSTELPLCGHGTLATAAVLFQGKPCNVFVQSLAIRANGIKQANITLCRSGGSA